MNKIIIGLLIIGCTLVGFSAGITWQYGQSADLIRKTPESGLETVREGFYDGFFDNVPTDKLDYMSIGNGCYEIYYLDNTSEEGCFND